MLNRITFQRAKNNQVMMPNKDWAENKKCSLAPYGQWADDSPENRDEIVLTRLTRYINFCFLLLIPIHCKPDKL